MVTTQREKDRQKARRLLRTPEQIEHEKQRQKEYKRLNPQRNKAKRHKPGESSVKRRKLKMQVFDGLTDNNPRCACCGEYRVDFLSVDHVLNDGAEHRRRHTNKHGRITGNTTIKMYRDIIREGFPKDRYRVLCMNCNWTIGKLRRCSHVSEPITPPHLRIP